MLILARRAGESLVLFVGEEQVEVKVISITGNITRLGVMAPNSVGIYRAEVLDRPESLEGSD